MNISFQREVARRPKDNAMTDSPDLSRVLEDARLLASRAVESERARRLELAAHLYRETARLIQSALQRGADTPGGVSSPVGSVN